MSLSSRTRIGPYAVIGTLGRGGMAEVFGVRDTQLGRDVAITVLPDLVVLDPERVARFRREAEAIGKEE